MMAESRTRTTDKRFYGVAEGIVTDVNDPQKEGRVKVKFPWFDDQMETEWCRVRQFYAGNGYGAFFVPEIGDEVLIAFIQGDMRLPVILGGLYNGQDKPPTHRDDNTDRKMVRTKAGHEITLDDSSGSEKITIVDSQQQNRIEIDTANNSIKLESNGGKLILKANEIEVSADATLKITAGGQMDIKGATINLN
jgi:phage baseplate assembly protein V